MPVRTPRKVAASRRPTTSHSAKPPAVPRANVKLTNLGKVLFPKTGFTKGQLIDYYVSVAPVMLPHLAGRAATLKRYPDGVEGKFFFEKRCPSHRPEWVRTIPLPTERAGSTGEIDYCEIRDVRTLAWVANLAAIELHVPLAVGGHPDRPKAMVFDLDPGHPADQTDCAKIALRLRALLQHLGLESLVKTSGGKGLHLLVPLNTPDVTFTDTKRFAEAVARTLERDDPKRVTASMAKALRPGRIFLDWSQNDRHKTTVAVCSVRARDEPTVSWPVEWERLERLKKPLAFRASDRLDLSHAADLLAGLKKRQRLPKV